MNYFLTFIYSNNIIVYTNYNHKLLSLEKYKLNYVVISHII